MENSNNEKQSGSEKQVKRPAVPSMSSGKQAGGGSGGAAKPQMQKHGNMGNGSMGGSGATAKPSKPVVKNTQSPKPSKPSQQVTGEAHKVNTQPEPDNSIHEGVNTIPETDSIDASIDEFNESLVEDTVQQNREKGKKVKKKKEKVELTPEQKSRNKKIAIVASVAVVAIIAIVCIMKMVSSNNSKHIVTVEDANKQHEQAEATTEGATKSLSEQASTETENGVENESETDSSEENVDKRLYTPDNVPSVNSSANIGEVSGTQLHTGDWVYIPVVINTKTAEDKVFTDHESQIFVRLSEVVSGYGGVSEYILSYNEGNSENKKITLPDKDSYYKQSSGSEMVMYSVEVYYPKDYPTSASEKMVYTLPNLSLDLHGTMEEIDNDDLTESPDRYIVVNEKDIYNISKITSMLDVPETIVVGHALRYNFVTSVPVGADETNYAVDVYFENGDNAYSVVYTGEQIEYSGYVLDSVETAESETGTGTDGTETEERETEEAGTDASETELSESTTSEESTETKEN